MQRLPARHILGLPLLPLLATRPGLRVRGIFDTFRSSKSPRWLQDARKLLPSLRLNNGVLQNTTEVENAINILRKLRLPLHPDVVKNWDALRALHRIVFSGNQDSWILDAGCGPSGGVLLRWLQLLGYEHLYGCDIGFRSDIRCGNILYLNCDLEDTGLPSSKFEFITSLSVIEHGIHIDAYFREMSRLLKPGGMLLNSTDYWPDPVDTRGVFPYRGKFGEMRVFTSENMERIFDIASSHDLFLVQQVDLGASQRVVQWRNQKYTFIYFEVRKHDEGGSVPG